MRNAYDSSTATPTFVAPTSSGRSATIPTPPAWMLEGEVDPSYLITHRWSLDQGPEGYPMFRHKTDKGLRVVLASC